LLILVNPRIEIREGERMGREGCLSVPDFTGDVRRAARVRLQAWGREGEPRTWWLEAFEAVVAQHEVDHLDGLLFLDRVANLATDVFRRKTYL
jgi:peptide deformylase